MDPATAAEIHAAPAVPALLALPGPAFALRREDGLHISGHCIRVPASTAATAADAALSHEVRTSETLWDGAVVLAKLLEHQQAAPGGLRSVLYS